MMGDRQAFPMAPDDPTLLALIESRSDPYRCPTCRMSTLRAPEVPMERRHGPYREGYLGPWHACPVHGIVVAFYDPAWSGAGAATSDNTWDQDTDAVDLLVAYRTRCPEPGCSLCAATAAFIEPILAARHEVMLDRHCLDGKHEEVAIDGDHGACRVCGRYWRLFDGIWFRAGRLPEAGAGAWR